MTKTKAVPKTKALSRTKTKAKEQTPRVAGDEEAQLTAFVKKFDERNQKLIRETRAVMRKRFPTAVELVYDNYNFFVIGYAASNRPSEAIFSIAAAANGVSLCFLFGASLKDPHNILRGAGNQVRSVRLPSASRLDEKTVGDLMTAAVAQSPNPFMATGKGELIIRSVSAKQRPRRRAEG